MGGSQSTFQSAVDEFGKGVEGLKISSAKLEDELKKVQAKLDGITAKRQELQTKRNALDAQNKLFAGQLANIQRNKNVKQAQYAALSNKYAKTHNAYVNLTKNLLNVAPKSSSVVANKSNTNKKSNEKNEK